MFKAYTEFQKLKRVMVGQTFPSSIVDSDFLKDKLSPTTKRLLGQLLDETEEDYQELVKICEDFGVEVLRPEYTNTTFVADEHPYLMNPRDDLIVLDDCLVCSQRALGTSVDYLRTVAEEKDKVKRNKSTFGLMPPGIVRLGNDIILDQQNEQIANDERSVNYLRDWLEPLGYNLIYTPTHSFKFKGKIAHGDGTLSLQKPGVLLTCNEAKTYTENIFKGWSACEVESGFGQMKNWGIFKADTRSYAFDDDKYIDPAWNKLVSTWLSEWVGYAKETIFDVNVLSLDENHVVVSNYNKEVFNFFKKHKIEPIICSWRHRYFWDGGIHCITVDLEREGEREQYL